MSLHFDLLKQAFHLAIKEPKKPIQASLRRSVSASYYALFHYLVDEATKLMLPGNVCAPLRKRFARSFDHGNMKKVAEQFSSSTIPYDLSSYFNADSLDESLSYVADSFVKLQKSRHNADYNLEDSLFRHKVLESAYMSKKAFNSWKAIRKTIQANTFPVGLHNVKNISKRE